MTLPEAPTAPTCPPPPGRSAQRGKVSRPAPPPPPSRPPPPPGAPASWSAWPGRARRTEPPARAEEGTAQEEGRGSGGRGGSSSSNEGVRGTPRPPRAAARARPGTPPPGRARTCGPAEPGRTLPASPPPPPPGSGLREGGVPRRGRGRRGPSSSGWGQGPARTPRLCTCSTSPPQRSVLPGPGRPPPVGRHRPPALLQPGRARRAARGGARGPPSLGPRRSWPRCPHFLPLPAGRAAWDGPGAPGSPELRARLTPPLSWQPLARSFRGRTMGYIARLRTESAWPAR
nr:basic proline-rich protein-like [Kogia breviceps]